MRTRASNSASLEPGTPRFTHLISSLVTNLPFSGPSSTISGVMNGRGAIYKSSSSSASTHSTIPSLTNSLNDILPVRRDSKWSLVKRGVPSYRINRGLRIRPLSVLMKISLFALSNLMDTSAGITPRRRADLKCRTKFAPRLCTP